jgi:hypothetical protein
MVRFSKHIGKVKGPCETVNIYRGREIIVMRIVKLWGKEYLPEFAGRGTARCLLLAVAIVSSCYEVESVPAQGAPSDSPKDGARIQWIDES